MASAWHSTLPNIKVYHNNRKCDLGDNINDKYRATGTGGKRICERCAELNKKKKRR
jgi:hypothetical protein